ncbi:GOLPH3/VPS74 family protein [Desulfitobacterium metallireducens]|uniref:GPP34 family phosphoprotein n=1 Tax=Desulfitobacterium metallireducens DSM 15288 TaxID=871968 RepID=W0E8U5_9FIRM|nr:GPP34 family phosphoprotein [Desulfitobacterium metallireducens]AHF05953.1 hypothetical protein DESME_01805 [Desulfitobacterium metallireducens DSM 15288]
MLDLSEELLLLAVHEEKGSIPFDASNKIDFCLAGALLIELELMNRVKADKKTLQVINRTSTGNSRLDTLLNLIDHSKKVRSPSYWITKSKGTFKHLRHEYLEQLVNQGILREEERQIFWIFPSTAYPLRDTLLKREIRDRVRLVILREETPSPRTARLIALVHACGLTNTIFDKEERKDARKKVKALAKEDLLVQAIIKTIQGSNSGAYAGSF